MSVYVQNKELRSKTQDQNFNIPHKNLTDEDKKTIRCESNDGWLEDSHMSAFSYLLNKAANYEIRPTYLRYNILEIKPVRKDRDHIQILHRPEHWTCSYYDGTNIYIYDTLQNFADPLHEEQKLFLEKLYPHITITDKTVCFPVVQQQKNKRDCGVMAIAFGVSLAFSIKPQNVYYNTTLMRNHLLKLLTEKIQFDLFPQDHNVKTPQQVLPIQVARQKCYERLRINIRNRRIKDDTNHDPTFAQEISSTVKNIFKEHNYSSGSNITNNNNMNKAITNGDEFMNDKIVDLRRSRKHSTSRANNFRTIPRSMKLRKMELSEKDEKIIQIGEWLEDTHINHFHNILRQFHGYEPIDTLLLQCPDAIILVDESKEHIQILFSKANDNWSDSTDGHWVCCYYDTNLIYIYDSLNKRIVHRHHEIFLKRLFPFYPFEEKGVILNSVQMQTNCNDCGVYAIANAVSLALGVKPTEVQYDRNKMRDHLIKMLKNNVIDLFPVLQYNVQANFDDEKNKNSSNMAEQILQTDLQKKQAENNEAQNIIDFPKKTVAKRRNRNGKYYRKNKLRFLQQRMLRKKNYSICKKPHIAKGGKIRKINYTIKFHLSSDRYIKNISKSLLSEMKNKCVVSSRLKAMKIYSWCMQKRKSYLFYLRQNIRFLKEKAEVALTRANNCPECNISDRTEALCGFSKHLPSSESYFYEAAYKHKFLMKNSKCDSHQKDKNEKDNDIEVNAHENDFTQLDDESVIKNANVANIDKVLEPLPIETKFLILNEKGQVTNVLPLLVIDNDNKKESKIWMCDDICKIDNDSIIQRYQTLLKSVDSLKVKSVHKFAENLLSCNRSYMSRTLGHSFLCYVEPDTCSSTFLPVLLLAPHFVNVRVIKRIIYRILEQFNNIKNLDKSLDDTDIEYLMTISEEAIKKSKATIPKSSEIQNLNEEKIMSEYKTAFKQLTKRTLDTAKNACISCEKLCYRKEVIKIADMRKPLKTESWENFKIFAEQNGLHSDFICKYCKEKFQRNQMPPTCVKNMLYVKEMPKEISALNEYERMFIQRAKAFQVVQRMETVSKAKKNIPHQHMIQKVKGRTFYLPLPMEETLKKICKPTDPININQEFYILVRSLPTKAKKVWEHLVNVKNVYNALVRLKQINRLYEHVILPLNPNELLKDDLPEVEYKIDDSDAQIENKTAENTDKQIKLPALLTQADKDDGIYEQYTIYPLYEKRINEKATTLYQQKKVEDAPLDIYCKTVDLQCFPHLYPYGMHGEHEHREVYLTDFECIKARLKSKHSQFRMDVQYLFFLLNQTNIRRLKAGIYQKLNIINPKEKCTASTYLNLLQKDLLERNLTTIFSRIPNTEPFWHIPRSNLRCMLEYYGPATWFLTLSPSEWLWSDLIEYVKEVNTPFMDKMSTNEILTKDPVSVSRFLDNKFHAMLEFFCSIDNPIGHVVHYFWRREYQGRGLQHFHLLIWIKDAPILGKDSDEIVAAFIQRYVTCRLPDPKISPTLYRRVNTHQRHHHNSYCMRTKKNNKNRIKRVCRFGFPRLVTENIKMRDVATSIAGRKQLRSRSRLYDLPRDKQEVNINDYNPIVLTAWEGNMDIQFVGENSTTLCWYCTKYVTKHEKSYAAEMFVDVESTKSLCARLWNIGMLGLNNRECGALEAADTLLGISLYGTDSETTIRWLDVNVIRNRRVKRKDEIENLDPDSTDIFFPNIIDDYYPNRPVQHESMSLYEFARWYDTKKALNNDDCNNDDDQDNNDDSELQCFEIGNKYFKKRKRPYLVNHYRNNSKTQPERYFYALLLLFQPWRDIDELKNGCDTYSESFLTVQTILEEAMNYHKKLTDLEECIEAVKEMVNHKINKPSQNNPNGRDENALECDPFEVGDAMKDFHDAANNVNGEELSEMIAGLNIDQKSIFDKVVSSINSENEILRLFVSGEGGTGKSRLIQALQGYIKQILGKETAVTAPTGIAAFNVNGLTVHRLFQLPVEHGGRTKKYKQLSNAVLKILRDELKNISLIIIDEVSMISNVTLMYINLRLMEIFNTYECDEGWFGKKHILVIGDLLQLPPVREGPCYLQMSGDQVQKFLGCLAGHNLWSLFQYKVLTINMRQKGDETYRQLLSRIRFGTLLTSDMQLLQTRQLKFNSSSYSMKLDELCEYIIHLPADTVCLLPTCHLCDTLNSAMLEKIESEKIELSAQDQLNCSKFLKNKVTKLLNKYEDDHSRTAGLAKSITIKIGARIMIRRNVDVTLGIVNGTIGTIISVTRSIDNKDDIDKITIVLPGGRECAIERVSVKFEVMERVFVIRKQFPICLSYGITIHKSQGLSLANAIIDAGNSVFSTGQVYVALSRITTLEGLHLINFDPQSVAASESAILEYNKLGATHDPPLPSNEIRNIKHTKIGDNLWAVPKGVLAHQIPIEDNADDCIEIRGLPNTDQISRYANAIMQCIVQCYVIKTKLLEFTESHEIRDFINDYSEQQKNITTLNIRSFIGGKFLQNVQQDASEFLLALCNNLQGLQKIIHFEMTTSIHCRKCPRKETTTNKHYILPLPVKELCLKSKKGIPLQDYVNIALPIGWKPSPQKPCEQCSEQMLTKIEITTPPKIIIMQLLLFSYDEKGDIIKEINCKITAAPQPISICNKKYKLLSAVFHNGLHPQSGSYSCMIRDVTSAWKCIDNDKINQTKWPKNAKNVYILFLQRQK